MPVMDASGFPIPNPGHQRAFHAHPYASSSASSASSSSSSVFSLDGVSSQTSISSSGSVDVIWENESSSDSNPSGRGLVNSSDSISHCSRGVRGAALKVADAAVPLELRQNPRRTGHAATTNGTSSSACARPPPSLVRQCERKVHFVDNLVDSASQIVETIWPLSVVALRSDSPMGCKGVLPLRTFIQETLRRSRTSYSTLQVALYYLIMIKPHVPKHDFTMEQPREGTYCRSMQCGRRMFLAALILASKYLQDRNYSARAWSKISGLNTAEINQNELAFLKAVDWRLHVSEPVFQRWTEIVLKYTPSASGSEPADGQTWKTVIPHLTPELDTVDLSPAGSPEFPAMELSSRTPSPQHVIPRNVVSSSNEVTPTCPVNLPMTLEPTPRIDLSHPPLPALARMNILPTPQLTPQSGMVNTPAASVGSACSRRPSICAAMSQAHSMFTARTTLDQRPAAAIPKSAAPCESYPWATRRSSLARSTSSVSSPESMISDVSTRSSRTSRSSSISSVSSASCAPAQPLAQRATRRCANLQSNSLKECRKNLVIATPIDESSCSELYASPDTFNGGAVPDLTNFSLGTPVDLTVSTQEAAQGLCELSGALPRSHPTPPSSASQPKRCRKRGRTSSDDGLQSNVRQLMSMVSRENEEDGNAVIPDHRVADSFLMPKPKAVQSLSTCELGSLRLPLPLSLPMSSGSMKRACCGSEVARHIWPTSANTDTLAISGALD